jgi:HD-like signal output (HDOD) protein
MAAAFGGVLPPILPGYGISRQFFIDHSMQVGLLAEQFVKALELPTFADPFTAGLLHDAGKLAMCRFVEMKKADIFSMIDSGSRWVDSEKALLGMDHTVLGQALAESWKLPESIGTCARWHHMPGAMPNHLDENLCVAVHVANEISHQLNGERRTVDAAIPGILGMPESMLLEVMGDMAARMKLLKPSIAPEPSVGRARGTSGVERRPAGRV